MNFLKKNLVLVGCYSLVLVNIFIWFLISLLEQNPSILIVHLFLFVASVTVFMLAKSIYWVFIVGVVIRSLAAAAWLLAATSSRRFDIGTNQDSSIFWDRASWGFHRLHEVHDYPFPAINFYIYDFSSGLGPPAYLAAVQVPLLAGALAGYLPLFCKRNRYAACGENRLVAIHFKSIVITFSTGLVRDTLICMFGLATLAGLMKLGALE